MPQHTLANRVEMLEHRMQSLEGLPERVASLEWQISQFREDVRLEFSAVREEARLNRDSLAATLRAEIRAGDEVGAVYMPAPETGSPMTYSLNGTQYIVLAIGGNNFAGELIAFRLPPAAPPAAAGAAPR